MTGLKMRDYQRETIDALYAGWVAGARSLAVQLPTGTGKTVIFAHLAKEWAADLTLNQMSPRVLVLVHRDELVRQAVDKLHSVAPDLKVGVVKAARNEITSDVVVASVQTLGRVARLQQIEPFVFGLVIVDEAHHATAVSYRRILDWFSDAKVAGFSATLSRADGQGLGSVFERVVIKRDILWGIVNGWLTDIRGKRVDVTELDLSDVKRSGGDYQDKALGEALIQASTPEIVAAQYLEHARKDDGTLRRGLIFWPSVAAAHAGTEATRRLGIRSTVIDGTTPFEDRQGIYKALRHGDLDVIHNCQVLTEGFDLPEIECIVIARPTSSPGLYIQMVGRGLRPSRSTGKVDCLLLDVVGVSSTLRLASPAALSETKISLRDGESLTEAALRTEAAIADMVAGKRGTITVHDVDLFATSPNLWLRTHKGYWFIPAGPWSVCVVPSDTSEDLFDVWCVFTGWKDRQPHYRAAERMVLDYAKAWAESTAMELEPMTANRKASWRKGKVPASAGQLRVAGNLRVILPKEPTKREVSDLISVALASNIIDHYRIPAPPKDSDV
jgi:superfamily II DNA or RNA helicase